MKLRFEVSGIDWGELSAFEKREYFAIIVFNFVCASLVVLSGLAVSWGSALGLCPLSISVVAYITWGVLTTKTVDRFKIAHEV